MWTAEHLETYPMVDGYLRCVAFLLIESTVCKQDITLQHTKEEDKKKKIITSGQPDEDERKQFTSIGFLGSEPIEVYEVLTGSI